MNPTLKEEEDIFDAARLITDAGARRSYLTRACGGDAGLRQRVEELLVALEPAEDFFAAGGSAVHSLGGELQALAHSEPTRAADDEQVGKRIGNYKLLERIGEGGCGAVYMAEQEKPVRRRVALKIIKLGMDTKSVIARFEAERQALAMMDHPNIARVLDAGATETGRPFFVMELVRGFKVTEYCDANHLDTTQRLHLFILICQAIQHAHQKGIIHRDIKPSNILVTLHDGVPVPKVIDFGIAKATEAQLTEKTLFTAYAQIIGTPAYMSPEQAEMSGLDIDTRADIYSLGVLLYELLTGRTPFDPKQLLQSGFDEMRRTLREREPQRPSTILTTLQNEELTATAQQRHVEPPKLISQLRGDPDWIVMKALEKDRKRRYETANALAMDIQRYLNNEPVFARPPSRTYRLQKLVRRNKAVFASGFAITLVLIVGLTTSTWLFFREREARKRAVDAEQQEAGLRQQAEWREKITQAALLVSQDNYPEANALLKGIPVGKPSIELAAVLRSVGDWHALNGRWQEAVECFRRLLQINQLDGQDTATLDHLEFGPALLEINDTAGYERFRQAAVEHFSAAPYLFSDRIIKICLLAPADERLLAQLKPQVEAAENYFAQRNDTAREEMFQAAWRSMSLALYEYRRGNYARAVEWCERCLGYDEFNAPRHATAQIILAMSYHQLRRSDLADPALAPGREAVETKFKAGLERGTGTQGFWFDWVFARILLREATGLLAQK